MNTNNVIVVGETSENNPMSLYIKDRLNLFADMYKEHHGFFNHHDEKMDTCPIIAITADGKICPLYNGRCTMNYLTMASGKDAPLSLSTSAFFNFSPYGENLDTAIARHNELILENSIINFKRNFIVGYVLTEHYTDR